MKELVIRSTICLILQTKNKQQLTSEDWTPILMWNKLFCSLETKAICILDRKKSQEGTGKQRAGPSSPASAVPASTAPPTIPWDHSYLRYMQIPAPFHPDPSTPTDWEQKLAAYAHKTWTISSEVHPNGFIFSPKTFQPKQPTSSNLLERKDRTLFHTVTAGIGHPTVPFCNAKAETTNGNQDLGYDGIC